MRGSIECLRPRSHPDDASRVAHNQMAGSEVEDELQVGDHLRVGVPALVLHLVAADVEEGRGEQGGELGQQPLDKLVDGLAVVAVEGEGGGPELGLELVIERASN